MRGFLCVSVPQVDHWNIDMGRKTVRDKLCFHLFGSPVQDPSYIMFMGPLDASSMGKTLQRVICRQSMLVRILCRFLYYTHKNILLHNSWYHLFYALLLTLVIRFIVPWGRYLRIYDAILIWNYLIPDACMNKFSFLILIKKGLIADEIAHDCRRHKLEYLDNENLKYLISVQSVGVKNIIYSHSVVRYEKKWKKNVDVLQFIFVSVCACAVIHQGR